MPVLTSNTLLYGQPIMVSEERLDEDASEIKRRQRLFMSTSVKRQHGKDGQRVFAIPSRKAQYDS